MGKIKRILSIISSLLHIFNRRQKVLAAIVVAVSMGGAIIQTLSVAILTPFLAIMMSSSADFGGFMGIILNLFGITEMSRTGGFVRICFLVIAVYIFKGIYSTFNTWISNKFSYVIQRDMSIKLMKAYLNRPYDFFLNYGSSKAIRDIYNDPVCVSSMLQSLFNIIIEALTSLFIVVYIVLTDLVMAACISVIAIICLIVIYAFFKRKMMQYGREKRDMTEETNKVLIESIEGIKETQVMRKQGFFYEKYAEMMTRIQKPALGITMASICPSYVIESSFVAGIVLFVCIRTSLNPDYIKMLPLLGSFMAGAIRMLPSLGRISSNLNGVISYLPMLYSLVDSMDSIKGENEAVLEKKRGQEDAIEQFDDSISISNVQFRYEDSERPVLDRLNMKIGKGESIGVIGASGAGKTTLIDLILGLHVPQSGSITVDGTSIYSVPDSWSRLVGYVPQTVFLLDGTIAENIAFGVKKADIDEELIWSSVKKAQLESFIETLPDGINTVVGERGVKISGGQRQRVAIARALYRTPQILVLDEATSALDNDTEAAVMEAIENLYGQMTMIIIAHRLTTVKKCDRVYEISGGKAREVDKSEIIY